MGGEGGCYWEVEELECQKVMSGRERDEEWKGDITKLTEYKGCSDEYTDSKRVSIKMVYIKDVILWDIVLPYKDTAIVRNGYISIYSVIVKFFFYSQPSSHCFLYFILWYSLQFSFLLLLPFYTKKRGSIVSSVQFGVRFEALKRHGMYVRVCVCQWMVLSE